MARRKVVLTDEQLVALGGKPRTKFKRARKPMTEEQKAAAAERLKKAREAKQAKAKKEGKTPKMTHHPNVYDEKLQFKPLKEVQSWLTNAKKMASQAKTGMRKKGLTPKQLAAASSEYHWWYGYCKDIQHYLRHGDWISNRWGMEQEKATKWRVIAPGNPDWSKPKNKKSR